MANQPTKYRKFIVGAASAALVASAVAPVASAAEFKDTKGNTHEPAIDALSDAGIITGYPDGTFQPNKTLTRSDVVKLMGKWLVSEGYAVPTDYKTNPRFADLKSTSNDELLQYAAVVKDNGVFVGTPDGKLDPAGNITRENMAIVLVRAFDRVHDIDLATYVAGQDFKKDVTDLGSAKAEARPAIDVLDFFDITNPAAPQFNPKSTTTRGHFATFLHKTLNADFSDVGSGVVGTANVKAVNATTVEVTFKDAVENLNSLNFTIDGLTVSNAAVKQTDNKTVVLTTAVQKGGEKYTVSLNNKEIGSFEGISAVVPTKINITNQNVQGKVGQQAIVSADVGVKQAGIPVTFNVKADTRDTLNKDQVFEAITNADGVATLSYTQYAAGIDEVVAYPTGAPTVRDYATVHWGVDTILSLEEDDKKGTSLNNGENKVYKVTYKDAKTGKPVPNADINVTFAENVDVPINKITDATINGKPAYQTTNDKVEFVTVKTDSKGEATFTVSGTNTKATPVVFVDGLGYSKTEKNDKLDRTELQVKAAELTFGAVHVKYELEVTRDGGEEAAIRTTRNDNGRVYKVAVKDENGKAAAGEVINVAFDEDLDRVISTNTKAGFVINNDDLKGTTKVHSTASGRGTTQIELTLDSKGEGEFRIVSSDAKDYATPVIWIDINSSSNKDGMLEDGEPKKVASMTYFAEEKISGSELKVYDNKGEVKNNRVIDGTAQFRLKVANQSGKPFDGTSSEFKATFQVKNTGTKDVYVWTDSTDVGNKSKAIVVSTKRDATVTLPARNSKEAILYVGADGETASVDVTAYGEVKDADKKVVRLSESKVAKATFKSSTEVNDSHQGVIENFNKDKKELKFVNKEKIEFKTADEDGKVKYYYVENNIKIPTGYETFSEKLANYQTKDVVVHYYEDKDGNIEFTFIEEKNATTALRHSFNVEQGSTGTPGVTPNSVSVAGLTFTSTTATDALNGYVIEIGEIADGTTTAASVDGSVIKVSGNFSATGTLATAIDVEEAINKLVLRGNAKFNVTGNATVASTGDRSAIISGGVTAVPAKTEVAKLTILSNARVAGDIKVTVNNASPTTVRVSAGDTPAQIAVKVKDALIAAGGVANYNITADGANVEFTSTLPGNQNPDLTVKISE